MKKAPNTTALKRLLGYRTFFIVNVVLLLIVGMSVGREFVRSAAIKREIASLEAERSGWEERKLSLEAYQDYLNTEAFLEKEAREKFGLQRPGETQVFVDEGLAIATTALSEEGVEAASHSPARLWLWYFFQPDRYSSEQS